MNSRYTRPAILTASTLIVGMLVLSSFFVPFALFQSPRAPTITDEQQTDFVLSNGVTPEVQWSRVTGGAVDSSPSVADVDGDGVLEVLVRSDDYYLYCLDATNGLVEWKFFFGYNNVETSPSLADIDNDGQLEVIIPAGTLYCIDASLGTEEWSAPGNARSSACIADVTGDDRLEVLVVDGTTNAVRCINSTGGEEWSTPDLDFTTLSSPTAADVDGDDQLEVLCGSLNYNFYCLNGDTGSTEWNFTTAVSSSYTPAVADLDGDSVKDIVFGTNYGHVYCLNGTMGGLEWDYNVGAYAIMSTPCIGDAGSDRTLDVFVGTQDNYLHCIDGVSGTQKWIKAASGDVDGDPCVVNVDGDDVLEVFVGADDYAMYCVDSGSGSTDWYYQAAGFIESSPYVGDLDDDGRIEIVFGSNDRNIYCLEAPEPRASHPWTGVGPRGDPHLTGCFLDNDSDLLTDNYEIIEGMEENMADSDGDSVDDYLEFILATDPLDGMTIYPHVEWSIPVESLVPSSPVVVDINDDGQMDLFVAFAGLLMCFDGSSLEQLWNRTYTLQMIDTIMVEDVNNDTLLEVLAVSANVLYCYRGIDGFQLWNYTAPYTLDQASCVCDTDSDGDLEIVFASAHSSDLHLYCVEGSTGNQIWNFTTAGLIAASPTAADLNHDGQLDIVFGAWDDRVYCLNASDGTELWRYTDISDPSGYPPVIADIDLDGDYEVFVGAFDNRIHCINGVNGSMEWRFLTTDYTLSSATIVDVNNDGAFEAIAPSRDGNVYCLNASGDMMWTYYTDGNIHCGASVADIDGDKDLEILVTSSDGYLHCIDGPSGLSEWTYYLGDYGWGIPTVVDFDGDNILEMIVTVGWSGTGMIYCLSVVSDSIGSDSYPWLGIAPLGDPLHRGRYIDTDLDFLVDDYEIVAGSDVFSSDPDTDLLSDYQEYLQSSDPMVDSVPPGAIEDLAISDVTRTSLVLNWNAPGENGAAGMTSSYIVKWSTTGPITEENWESATTYSQTWTPLAPDNPESHQVTGLSGGQEYWFAIRAFDEDSNIGEMSNSPGTTIIENILPGTIIDLAVVNTTTTTATLTWTAPGDDGASGTASGYEVRYSLIGSINDINWDSADIYGQSWIPLSGGSTETRILTGLDIHTTYWFVIKAYDDVDNYGLVSNSPEVQTNEAEAPDAIADLSASSISSTWVTLTWTAPGDDQDTGIADGYVFKYLMTGPITEENWDTAIIYEQSWTPSVSGTAESRIITGLIPNTDYWFAIVAFDEVPNYGELSNVLSVTTLEDTPPNAVTDLVMIGQNSTSIVLSWTAPGDDGTSGTVSGYLVKYSSEGPITTQNWNAIESSIEFLDPLASGETEIRIISGLTENTSYWIAMVAFDEVPNLSDLSNLVYGHTTSTLSTTMPFESGLLIGIAIGATVVVLSLGLVVLLKKRKS